jgi:Probable cobalt transporter subunit (CbtA)
LVSGLLLRGLLAGLLAGLFMASFSYLAGEPSIERAIAFESVAEQTEGHAPTTEIVSRNVQRSAGLFTASIVYGAAIGGLFSLVFAFCYGRLGDFDPQALSVLLALAGFAALVLLPDLKYPANPPAIGAASTIGARTALYFAMLAISLLAVILAMTLAPHLMDWLGAWNGVLAAAAIFLAVAGLAAMALPPVDEVPAGFPATVLWNFRLASIGARAVLWGTLGLSFGGMSQKWLCLVKPHSA